MNVIRQRYASAETFPKMIESVPIYKASIEDISKALCDKPRFSVEEARNRLPDQIKIFTHLFVDSKGVNDLPPFRVHLDRAISLRQENVKPMSPPWGPLYNISWKELLVLRKTLIDLLERVLIHPSSSPASAPVLFARKPNGGLRFCVYYRSLNAIKVPDRYSLSLIKETLRQLSKVRWSVKLDVNTTNCIGKN